MAGPNAAEAGKTPNATAISEKNIYELGKVFQLRKVITVEDLPQGGVRVGDSSLDVEVGKGEVGTMEFTDRRFTSKDLQPGDIVRMDEEGPSLARISEVYREGLRIWPARKTQKAELTRIADSNRQDKEQHNLPLIIKAERLGRELEARPEHGMDMILRAADMAHQLGLNGLDWPGIITDESAKEVLDEAMGGSIPRVIEVDFQFWRGKLRSQLTKMLTGEVDEVADSGEFSKEKVKKVATIAKVIGQGVASGDFYIPEDGLYRRRESALATINLSPDQLEKNGLILLPFVLEIKEKGKKPRTYLLIREHKGKNLENSHIFALKADGKNIAENNQDYPVESEIEVKYWERNKESQLGSMANDIHDKVFDVSTISKPHLFARIYLGEDSKKAVGNLERYSRPAGEAILKGYLYDFGPSYESAIESIGKVLVSEAKA